MKELAAWLRVLAPELGELVLHVLRNYVSLQKGWEREAGAEGRRRKLAAPRHFHPPAQEGAQDASSASHAGWDVSPQRATRNAAVSDSCACVGRVAQWAGTPVDPSSIIC